jgi:CRISPR-associated exonuclease Cas4
LPEVPIYASLEEGPVLVAGRADAIAYDNGLPEIVFDWKSDVAPSEEGAVIYLSLGQVHWVEAA